MRKQTLILTAILAVLVIIYLIVRSHEPTEQRIEFFEVDPQTVAVIDIISPSDSLRLEKERNDWYMEDPFRFRVARERITNIFDNILQARTSRIPISESPQAHQRYNVTDSLGTRLIFYDDEYKPLYDVILGQSENQLFTNARRYGEKEVYQLRQNIMPMLKVDSQAWRSRHVVQIPEHEIAEVSIRTDELDFTLSAEGDSWHYEDRFEEFYIPPDNLPKDNIFNGLRRLRASDFIDFAYDEYADKFKEPIMLVEVQLRDGSKRKLEFAQKDEQWYMVKLDDNPDHLYLVLESAIQRFSMTAADLRQ
jgi:hypothetical protein